MKMEVFLYKEGLKTYASIWLEGINIIDLKLKFFNLAIKNNK